MRLFKPKKIFVEKAAMTMPRAQRILRNFPEKDILFIENQQELDFSFLPLPQRFMEAKKCLALALKHGSLVKEFRRHHALKQDKEYYLLHAANCPFDCCYCYLQNYFAHAVPTIFVDTAPLFEQVKAILRDSPEKEVLFHAGQTADALALEHFSGFAAEAVPFFSKLDNAVLELRSKSDLIEPLLPLRHNRRTVVSWTLTPDEISRQYEKGAASISERLHAATQCQSAGYPIGLRLDPLIHYSSWKEGYRQLIESIFAVLSPEAIDSIVLGTFRCQPPLLDLMRERFGRTELVLGEFVPGPDGKMRYFRHIREQMYRGLTKMLRDRCGEEILSKIELSMEPAYVWEGTGLSSRSGEVPSGGSVIGETS